MMPRRDVFGCADLTQHAFVQSPVQGLGEPQGLGVFVGRLRYQIVTQSTQWDAGHVGGGEPSTAQALGLEMMGIVGGLVAVHTIEPLYPILVTLGSVPRDFLLHSVRLLRLSSGMDDPRGAVEVLLVLIGIAI